MFHFDFSSRQLESSIVGFELEDLEWLKSKEVEFKL